MVQAGRIILPLRCASFAAGRDMASKRLGTSQSRHAPPPRIALRPHQPSACRPTPPPGTVGPGLHAGKFIATPNPGHGHARRGSALGWHRRWRGSIAPARRGKAGRWRWPVVNCTRPPAASERFTPNRLILQNRLRPFGPTIIAVQKIMWIDRLPTRQDGFAKPRLWLCGLFPLGFDIAA